MPNGLKSASESTFQTQIPSDNEHILGAGSIAAHDPSSATTPPRPVQQTSTLGHSQDAKITSQARGEDAFGNGNAARNAALASQPPPIEAPGVDPSAPNPQVSGSWTALPAQVPATNGVQKPTLLVAHADGRPTPHYPPSFSWPTNGLPGTATAANSSSIPTNHNGRTLSSPLGPATGGSDGKKHGLYLVAPNVVAGPAPSANP